MIRDEDLAVYLDGETDVARTQAIEAALQADPLLRARLERLQRGAQDVQAAFGALLERPVPDRLEQAVRAAAARAVEGSAHSAEVIAFEPRRPRAARWAWPASIAAALVGGLLVGQLAAPSLSARGSDWLSGGAGAPRAGAVLAAGLSTAPSGAAFSLPGGRKAVPVLTFASRSGALCRQFDVAGPTGRQSELACRAGAGGWRLVALAPTERAGGDGDYRTAAGPGGDPVSALADRLIKGEPLDAAQEAAALCAASARSGTPAR